MRTGVYWKPHSLCYLDGLGHGQEGAVGEDGEHDQVVEVLFDGQVDGSFPKLKEVKLNVGRWGTSIWNSHNSRGGR
jgi:hypothetical protein